MKNFIKKADMIFVRGEKIILSFSVVLMMLNSVANATGRYLFDRSIFFSEELNQFLIVYITFMGLVYAMRVGRSIRMTAFYDMMSKKNKKKITVLIAFVSALLMLLLSYESVLYIIDVKQIGRQSPALQVDMYLVYLIAPFGFFMSASHCFVICIKNLIYEELHETSS